MSGNKKPKKQKNVTKFEAKSVWWWERVVTKSQENRKMLPILNQNQSGCGYGW